jgi:hypothetical protein
MAPVEHALEAASSFCADPWGTLDAIWAFKSVANGPAIHGLQLQKLASFGIVPTGSRTR